MIFYEGKEGSFMKSVVLSLVVVVFSTSVACAGSIVFSKHNLSSTSSAGGIYSTETTQVCVFCHTPHNAVYNRLLWNRSIPTTTFKMFTSTNFGGVAGSNLKTILKASVLDTNSTSYMCLSCHDRSAAQLVSDMGPSNGGVTAALVGNTASWPTYQITNTGGAGDRSLTDDHPIGFSYGDAVTAVVTVTPSPLKALAAVTPVLGTGAFFSNSAGKTDAMECATCHMTHDNDNGYFLRISNSGSQLCLACHIK